MPNATLTPPSGIQTGNFNVMVAFTAPITSVTGFDDADITITAVSGNGITGITFEVTGSGANYNITFQLPEDVEGRFRITISGMVTVEGGSGPEAVMANSPVVAYNNITNIRATLNKTNADYRQGGIVAIPISLRENVIAPSKTICKFSNPTTDPGDGIAGIEDFYIVGEDASYELVVQIATKKKGRFVLGFEGDVIKASSGIWDNVVNSQAEADRTFGYNTREPVLKKYDIPENYTPGEIFDVILQYEEPVTLSPLPQGSTSFLDHFIFEGADLGQANIYRKTDDVYPTLPIVDFPVTGNSEWVPTNLTTETATIYLIRFPEVDDNATGIFNMTIRPGAFRGPVS